jgi:uncharacterized membrane protein
MKKLETPLRRSSSTTRLAVAFDLLAIAALLAYAYQLYDMSLARFYGRTMQGDLAAIWQSIYNVAFHGAPISSFNCSVHEYYTLISKPDIFQPSPAVVGCHQLGVHFHALIYPLALVARIFPDPTMLLMVQTLALTAAGAALYGLTRLWTDSRAVAFALLLSFLLNPFTHGINLNEFHFDAFFPLLIFAAIYFYESHRTLLFWLTVVGVLAVKESGSLVVFGIGCLFLFNRVIKRQNLWTPAALLVVGPLALYLITELIMPPLSFTGAYMFGGIYGCKLGSSASEILKALIVHPIMALASIWTEPNRQYLFMLLATTSPLVLLRPQWLLIAAPLLFINIITSNVAMKLVIGQYSAAVFPAFYIALAATLRQSKSLAYRRIVRVAFLASLVANASFFYSDSLARAPLPSAKQFREELAALAKIPAESAVCADASWVSFLASRSELFLTPVNITRCEFIAWDKATQWYMPEKTRAAIMDYITDNFVADRELKSLTIYRRRPRSDS